MNFSMLGSETTVGPDPEYHKGDVVANPKGQLGEVYGWVQRFDGSYVYFVEFSYGYASIEAKYLTYIGEL